jgi:ribose transport system ATP-binding protein
VDLTLRAGELLCVVGENGAGKSTLMKILGGVHVPDTGEIFLDGRPVQIGSVAAAQRLGIALIHQELNLCASLDAAGNIFLGREPRAGGPLGLIRPAIYRQAEVLLKRLGLECSPRTRVADLPVGQQQLVEIARALSMDARILIMDEPTSSLTDRETERLFAVMHELKQSGAAIIYISHRLNEVRRVADRVTVLRDGRNAGDLPRGEITHEALVRRMVGRDIKQFFHHSHEAGPRSADPNETPVLSVSGLRYDERQAEPVSFELRRGEVVGMAGLMGAGRTELAEALFGVRKLQAGEVLIDGRRVNVGSPQRAIRAGLLLVPEDRRQHGLLVDSSVAWNISLPSLTRLSRARMVSFPREREMAQAMCQRLNVRTPSIRQIAALLSGGNQQKVVLAKWLGREPRVLVLDEPTRGIDVGAKAEIYALIDRLAREGVGILMISSDLEEILGVCDRVLVLHDFRLAGDLPRERLSEQAIMTLATGGRAAA